MFDEDSDTGQFLEEVLKYPKRFHNLQNELPFLPERMKIKIAGSLYTICMIKTTMLRT